MNKDEVFATISSQENEFRVHATLLLEGNLKIVVLKGQDAHETLVTIEELENLGQKLNVNVQEYCFKLLNFIRCPSPNIVVTFTEDREFIVNQILENKLTVKYFDHHLDKVNYQKYVEKTLDGTFSENVHLLERLKILLQEKEDFDLCNAQYEEKLTALRSKMKFNEDDLYGKFILIVNEKKRHIQHLTELLEAFRNGRSTNSPVENKKRKRNQNEAPKKLEIISETESSEDYNTDSDEPENQQSSPQPSTSKEDFDMFKDESPKKCTILPKRLQKPASNSSDCISSTKKQESKIIPSNDDDESPTVDISTQQLLDML